MKVLEFSRNRIESVGVLSKMKNLKALNGDFNRISDINVLDNFTLHTLEIANNPIADLEPISRQLKLSTLNASGLGIEDLSLLAGMTSLKNLY